MRVPFLAGACGQVDGKKMLSLRWYVAPDPEESDARSMLILACRIMKMARQVFYATGGRTGDGGFLSSWTVTKKNGATYRTIFFRFERRQRQKFFALLILER